MAPQDAGAPVLVSAVIYTFNRRHIVGATIEALARQNPGGIVFEIIVVDNGSTDGTFDLLRSLTLPCGYRPLRIEPNRGVAGGVNAGIREARGRYLALLSDDIVVPPEYLSSMMKTLDELPAYWVVGGMRQLPALSATPFGRYLTGLEEGFEEARKARSLGPDLWELSYPTMRNLMLPRVDLDRVGLLDEQFPFGCEDQDLAERAMALGIRFAYTTRVISLHNDGSARLDLCCRSQERGAYSTVLFCAKYPKHRDAAIARVNGPVSPRDGPRVVLTKLIKRILAGRFALFGIDSAISVAERLGFSDAFLSRLYRMRIGISIFRGWRQGLAVLGEDVARKRA